MYICFLNVNESWDIVLKLSASYDSDAYDHLWSTLLFRIEKNEELNCKPSSQNFENFELFWKIVFLHIYCIWKGKLNKLFDPHFPKDSEYVKILGHSVDKDGKK